ncbi:translocase of outer mitochondrial membrane [Dispira parvispora]|uniref:Translocase of outer mitochondrial membrane n=1 Tax=Dispira parvispora TaxID=1520584 RepID=A0A9W8AUR6_9FUNG|nr:translocase of outer mitochondrial membrane [Dispira parvispora]
MSTPSNVVEESVTPQSSWSPFQLYSNFYAFRQGLALPNPGTAESFNKEIKNTFLTNYFFDGARADLTKILSPNFQVTHSIALGTAGAPSTYHFTAMYAGPEFLLHGMVDTDGVLQSRIHYNWTSNLLSKAQLMFTGLPNQNMLQVETDYQGLDYSLNFKALNPSPADNSGIYIGNYLQSITKNLVIGFESMIEKPPMRESTVRSSLLARHSVGNAVATVQWQGGNALQASYHQKINEKVEFGTELQISVEEDKRAALCNVGAKYDFRQATFRGQVDSSGKVTALLEEKMAPGFSLMLSAEVDHAKGQNKVGVGLMLES